MQYVNVAVDLRRRLTTTRNGIDALAPLCAGTRDDPFIRLATAGGDEIEFSGDRVPRALAPSQFGDHVGVKFEDGVVKQHAAAEVGILQPLDEALGVLTDGVMFGFSACSTGLAPAPNRFRTGADGLAMLGISVSDQREEAHDQVLCFVWSKSAAP